MCGILCILDLLATNRIRIDKDLETLMKRRGPDCHVGWLENNIAFHGYLLWQQGLRPISQPLISEKYVLLLNGDVFNSGKNNNISDSTWLLAQLELCDSEFDILNLFRNLKGPFSIIFYNRELKVLYFGRDLFGRNSLLIEKDEESRQIRILSNSYMSHENIKCIELPAIGLFALDCNNFYDLYVYPWKIFDEHSKDEMENVLDMPISIKECIKPKWLDSAVTQADFDFYDLVHTIDNGESGDIFSTVLEISNVLIVVNKLLELLHKSVQDRVLHAPNSCNECVCKLINNSSSSDLCQHSKIGILFSGGLDCSILAVLVHKILPLTESIDLINVAFEKNSTMKSEIIDWNVPDRCSAKESYLELQTLYPERKWNLIEVNVTRNELVNELSHDLRHLIYPLETILDESLGSAFWFAARGQGCINNVPYRSQCRIVLIGTGADELFGGYTRHRNAYLRTTGSHIHKVKAVHQELQFDWQRIHTRNLGRDDRVIAYHGKTARAPYIEEEVVQFTINLRAEQKCCFALEQGIGDKYLLRLCAYKLGLHFPTKLKKRAFQFGSRLANKTQNARDISKYLANNKVH